MSDLPPYPTTPLVPLPTCSHGYEGYRDLTVDDSGNTPPFTWGGKLYQGFRKGTHALQTQFVIIQYVGNEQIAYGLANGLLQIPTLPDFSMPPAEIPANTTKLRWENAFALNNLLWGDIHVLIPDSYFVRFYRMSPDPIDPFPFYKWINFSEGDWTGRFYLYYPPYDGVFEHPPGAEYWVGITANIWRDVDFYHIIHAAAPSVIPLLLPLLSVVTVASAGGAIAHPNTGRRWRKVL